MGQRSVDSALRAVAVVALAIVVILGVAAPHGWFGPDSVAQSVPANLSEHAPPLRATGAASAGGFSYLLTSKDHEYPARWCTGTTLGYTIDFDHAVSAGMDPDQELQRWRWVFDQWSQASGGAYNYEYRGVQPLTTRSIAGNHELDLDAIRPATIGITYVHGLGTETGPAEYFADAVVGTTAGNGGLQVVTHSGEDSAALIGDRGFIMIDAQDAVGLSPRGLRRTLYLHEAGHALGLGHVASRTSVMNATLSSSRDELRDGDIRGIRSLAQLPCRTD